MVYFLHLSDLLVATATLFTAALPNVPLTLQVCFYKTKVIVFFFIILLFLVPTQCSYDRYKSTNVFAMKVKQSKVSRSEKGH